ncbi:MAG: hypothetical protein JXQ75_19645 [Phycisphaerae bacterium]|nr:hypothetical protein [Phycisphaerae bacterium]
MRVSLPIHLYALLVILPVAPAWATGQAESSSKDVSIAATRQTMNQSEAARATSGAHRRIRMIPLKFADAPAVAALGMDVFAHVAVSEAPAWVPDARTNTLIVTASEDQLKAIEAMIAKLDVEETADRITRTFAVDYAEPWQLPKMINEQLRATRRDPVIVSYINGTMSILVTASPPQMERVMAIVEQVDIPSARGAKETKFIRPKHARAAVLAELLTRIHQAETPRPRDGVYPITYTADEDSNTLIVTATAKDFVVIISQVEQLDVPKPSGLPAVREHATHVQIGVFETLVGRDQIVELDATKLAEDAATCQSLRDALGRFGPTKILYRADQTVEPSSRAKLTIGARRPFVRGTQAKSGQVTSQTEYEDLGCVVELFGLWDEQEPTRGHVNIGIELSGLSDSGIDIGNNVLAPVFHRVKQQFEGPVTAGEPVVLLTTDASGGAETAVAHVTRILFRREP